MPEIFSYDRLLYPSKFFVQTSPDRLATQATLFGMTPAAVETCSVLELGCGDGFNLISQAFLLPDARFVGIDLGREHIAEANAEAAALGLKNVEFAQMDVMEMSESDFGKFDFIIAHGLFSWVPDIVREKVLALFKELLNENGVGYISYSAGPGAHAREAARHAMRFHTSEMDDPMEKSSEALSFLSFLSENAPELTIYKAALMSEVQRHQSHSTSDIFHDDLSDINRTFYFHEFAKLLEEAGLQYLAEAELHAMGTHGLSKDAAEFVEATESIIDREQYLDLFRNREFRQTLLCHDELDLEHEPAPEILSDLLIASPLSPKDQAIPVGSTRTEKFVGSKGETIEIDVPLAKAALVHLGRSWGKAVPFNELVNKAEAMITAEGKKLEKKEEQLDILRKVLMRLAFSTNLVQLHVHQPDAPTHVPEKPIISSLNRRQMARANNILTGLNIDIAVADPVSRKALELMDGTRRVDDIAGELASFVANNRIDEIDKKKTFLRDLPSWLDDNLKQLARLGAFIRE